MLFELIWEKSNRKKRIGSLEKNETSYLPCADVCICCPVTCGWSSVSVFSSKSSRWSSLKSQHYQVFVCKSRNTKKSIKIQNIWRKRKIVVRKKVNERIKAGVEKDTQTERKLWHFYRQIIVREDCNLFLRIGAEIKISQRHFNANEKLWITNC